MTVPLSSVDHRAVHPTLLAGVAVLAIVALALAMRPEPAGAHPLGNFTINRYARIEPGASQVQVFYVIDMAEIPTFQEMSAIDRDRDNAVSDAERAAYLQRRLPELARGLRLTVGGTVLPLSVESGSLALLEGQGGLQVLRVEGLFQAELPNGLRSGLLDVQFRDMNFDDRLGWKEIVVRSADGGAVRASSVPSENTSDELRSYPNSFLTAPLEVREARFQFEPGVGGAGATQSGAARVAERTNRAASPGILSRFAESAATKELTFPIIVISLLAAVFWGAVHALGPGHGKTVVAAYLVGSRGTAKHAAFLGLTVTATHTASTYLLGFVTLFASAWIVPERLFPFLSLASGLMVMGMGMTLLAGRMRSSGVWPFRKPAVVKDVEPVAAGSAARPHVQTHSHGFGRAHSHGPADFHGRDHALPGANGRPVTWRSLLALGIYGGMLPCPTAIVVLLISISLDRVAFGLLLVVAFSLGLAGVLMGIGFALVFAGRSLNRFSSLRGATLLGRALPVMSAVVVVLAGILITLRAAGQGGLPLI